MERNCSRIKFVVFNIDEDLIFLKRLDEVRVFYV